MSKKKMTDEDVNKYTRTNYVSKGTEPNNSYDTASNIFVVITVLVAIYFFVFKSNLTIAIMALLNGITLSILLHGIGKSRRMIAELYKKTNNTCDEDGIEYVDPENKKEETEDVFDKR